MKLLVTNIQIKPVCGPGIICGKCMFSNFEVPYDTTEIDKWLADYNYEITTTENSYAAWIRSTLCYGFEWTYDHKLLKEDAQISETVDQVWLADLADMAVTDYRPVLVHFDIPTEFVIDLSIDSIDAADDINMAIFEYLICNMPINIDVSLEPIDAGLMHIYDENN